MLLKAVDCATQVLRPDHFPARLQVHPPILPENSVARGRLGSRILVDGVFAPLSNTQELCERHPLPPPRRFVLLDRAGVFSQRVERRKATIKQFVHVCSGCSDMALGEVRQAGGRTQAPKTRGEGRHCALHKPAQAGSALLAPASDDRDHSRQHGRRRRRAQVGVEETGQMSAPLTRKASATAAKPPEDPGCISMSPASGSKSNLKTPCSGTREPRKAATPGGTSIHRGVWGAHRVVHRGRGVPEGGHGCMHRPWGWLRQRHGAHGAAA
eukprot:529603-Pleurochrysis_carterae.AAC.1